ncbi:MAG: hypothetical protein JWO38_1895 [Gemmataceae bacterium]|nr:hypothetical protein [Gemmataceae bacterium]
MSRPRSGTSRNTGGCRGRMPISGDRDEAAEARIRAALAPLIDHLLDPDGAIREVVVRHVLAVCHPVVIGRVVDDLVMRVAEGESGIAAAALAGFGARAIPALSLRFTRSRNAAVQARLAGVVVRMAPGLTTSAGVDLMTELVIWTGFAAGPAVQARVGEAIAAVRAGLASPPPPGPRAGQSGTDPAAGA